MLCRSLLIVVSIAALLFFTGCSDEVSYQNYAEKYQLRQTNKFDYQFERAILYTNAMLPDTFRYRLIPTWKTSQLSPLYTFHHSSGNKSRFFESAMLNDSIKECKFHNYLPIPVYLIEDEKLGQSENIFVPDHDQCIFVNVRFVDTVWRDFGINKIEPDRRHMFVLALILLHELGHLNNGDNGSYTAPQKIDWDKKDPGDQLKDNPEYKADLFAIDRIRGYKNLGRFSSTYLQLSPDYLSGDFFRALSYGRSEFEINRDILGYFSGKRSFLNFQVHKYTHPDLYLRFLLMNYAISKDPDIIKTIRENTH